MDIGICVVYVMYVHIYVYTCMYHNYIIVRTESITPILSLFNCETPIRITRIQSKVYLVSLREKYCYTTSKELIKLFSGTCFESSVILSF
jgi:hypothetical protein